MAADVEYLRYPTICPFCFKEYQPEEIEAEVPLCIECHADGRDILVQPREEVLAELKSSDLVRLKKSWEENQILSPVVRQAVLERLEHFRDQLG